MKRSFTRIFCTLLSCLLLVGFLAGGVVAMAEDAATGQCGQNLTWRYDPETGVLTIEGEGNMWDYDSIKLMPWFQYAGNIKKIVLSNGVTSIGKNAFACCAVEEVEFPETLKTIGEKAFYQCEKLAKVDLSKTQVTTVAQKAFAGCKELKAEEVKLPETAKSVAANAFEKAVVKPVQAPAPVQPPVEAPQEPAAPDTWEETLPNGRKLVMTLQADGTLTTVCYLKDGSVDYRSVTTYGADGKVHEETKFTDGTFQVEDRIEDDKDGYSSSGTRLVYDKNNKLTGKTIFKTEGNVTVDTGVDLEDERVVLYETTTTLHDDDSYTMDFVGYDNGKPWTTRNGHYDKDDHLIKETYTQTFRDNVTTYKKEGTRVPGENGTVIDTYQTTSTQNIPAGPNGEIITSTSYSCGTATEDSAGRVIFVEREERNDKGEVTERYNEATKYNEDGSSVCTGTSFGADGKVTSTSETAYDKDGSSVSKYTSLGADGKPTSIHEESREKEGHLLKSTDIWYDATDSNGRPCVQTTTRENNGDICNITTQRDFEDRSTEESTEVRKNDILVSRDTVIKDSDGKQISAKQESMVQTGDDSFKYTSTETSEGKVIVTKEDRVMAGSMTVNKTVTTTDENAKTETVEKYGPNGIFTEKKETNTETGAYSVTTVNPDGTLKTEHFDKDGNSKQPENTANEPASLEALEEEKPVDDGFLLEDRDLDDEISDGMDSEEGTPVVDGSDGNLNHDNEISDGMDSEKGTPVADGSDGNLNHDDESSDGMDSEEGAPVADVSDGNLNHDNEISDGMDSEEGAPVADVSDEKAPNAENSDAENTDVKASSEKNADVQAPSTESTGKENTSAESSTTQVTPAPAADTQATPAPASNTQAAPAPAASTQTGTATTQVTTSQKESDKKDADKKKDKKKKKKGVEDLLDEETTTEASVAKEEIA